MIPDIEGKALGRFFSKLKQLNNGCIEWIGSKNRTRRNYGLFKLRGKMYLAHRLMYYLYWNIQPKNYQVCHHCDFTSCVNPHHLFIGTGKDNMQDMIKKGRSNYAYGERSAHKLTDNQVKEIREAIGTHKAIADKYDVNQSTITRIKNWKRRQKYVPA